MRFLSIAFLLLLAGLVVNDPGLHAQQPGTVHSSQTCKICVSEPQPNTRKVYACKTEEYCLPVCGLLSWLRGPCGCDPGPCGDLKVRHRLVVKKVPDSATNRCVPRAVPATCSVPVP